MWATAHGIRQQVPPSPLSPAKLCYAATSIIACPTHQYPRIATLMRNIQAAPTQEYFQSQLYALKDARNIAQVDLKNHPMIFRHATLPTFSALAQSPDHSFRRLCGHLPVATFQHIPEETATPTLVFGRPPTLPADVLRSIHSSFEEDLHRFYLLQTQKTTRHV